MPPVVSACDHEFSIEGPHCIRCGHSFEEPDRPKLLGAALTVLGILGLLACAFFMVSSRSAGGARLGVYGAFGSIALVAYGAKLLIPSAR